MTIQATTLPPPPDRHQAEHDAVAEKLRELQERVDVLTLMAALYLLRPVRKPRRLRPGEGVPHR